MGTQRATRTTRTTTPTATTTTSTTTKTTTTTIRTTTTTTTTTKTTTATIPTTPFTTTSTATEIQKLESTGAKDFSHLNADKCGTQTKLSLRITFGRSALPGQFPWAASLQYRRKPGGRAIFLCGGALISS